MISEFFTIDTLLTFTGCVMATGIITEMFKKIGFLLRVPNQLISYVVALIIFVMGNLALSTFSITNLFLSILNAAVVSLAANGGYDMVAAVAYKGKENEEQAAITEMMRLEDEANNPNTDTERM